MCLGKERGSVALEQGIRAGGGEMDDSYTPFSLLIVISAVVLTPWPCWSVVLSCAACLIVYGKEAHLCT